MSDTAMATSSNKVRASLAGAIVAAIVASACCLGPAILAIVGLSGAGLAATLAPYRPLFLGITAALLGLGFYLSYRKPRATATAAGATTADACCDTAGCEMPRAARTGRKMLWISTVLVAVFAAYPHIAGAFSSSSGTGTATPVANAKTAQLRVEGMTCEACSAQIAADLGKVNGVISVDVKYRDGLAIVTYDPARVEPEAFAPVIENLGYEARRDK